jgi:hypothetical protein
MIVIVIAITKIMNDRDRIAIIKIGDRSQHCRAG